jgi:hypothetical protein
LYVLLALEAATGFDQSLFEIEGVGFPKSWSDMGYLSDACNGPALLSSMLPHRRIENEVAQRIRKCSNPGMVIDLARSVLVALFWAAGRGADGAGMSVKGHRHSTPTLHGRRPV